MTHLALVNPETGEIPVGAPSYAEALARIVELEERIVGLDATIHGQAGQIGRLKRQLEESDIDAHPQRTEILALIDHWRRVTGHPKAKQSKDRIDVIRARLKDGYTIDQLRLAIDGLAAFPYVRQGQRSRTGAAAERHDRLGIALGGGEAVEKFANLGAIARRP